MKHTWKITFLLISMFFVAQIVGLAVTTIYHPVTPYESKYQDYLTMKNTKRINKKANKANFILTELYR